jgi:hypothetical protein
LAVFQPFYCHRPAQFAKDLHHFICRTLSRIERAIRRGNGLGKVEPASRQWRYRTVRFSVVRTGILFEVSPSDRLRLERVARDHNAPQTSYAVCIDLTAPHLEGARSATAPLLAVQAVE